MAEQRQTRREMSGDSPTKIDADKYDQIRASGRHITALDVSQMYAIHVADCASARMQANAYEQSR